MLISIFVSFPLFMFLRESFPHISVCGGYLVIVLFATTSSIIINTILCYHNSPFEVPLTISQYLSIYLLDFYFCLLAIIFVHYSIWLLEFFITVIPIMKLSQTKAAISLSQCYHGMNGYSALRVILYNCATFSNDLYGVPDFG